ncbi:MAG: hypothetical protein ACK40O_12870 [Allosphingosinicella sp.]
MAAFDALRTPSLPGNLPGYEGVTDAGRDNHLEPGVERPWRRWALLFAPLVAASIAGASWRGTGPTAAGLTGLLIVVLLYQRFVNGRA